MQLSGNNVLFFALFFVSHSIDFFVLRMLELERNLEEVSVIEADTSQEAEMKELALAEKVIMAFSNAHVFSILLLLPLVGRASFPSK